MVLYYILFCKENLTVSTKWLKVLFKIFFKENEVLEVQRSRETFGCQGKLQKVADIGRGLPSPFGGFTQRFAISWCGA